MKRVCPVLDTGGNYFKIRTIYARSVDVVKANPFLTGKEKTEKIGRSERNISECLWSIRKMHRCQRLQAGRATARVMELTRKIEIPDSRKRQMNSCSMPRRLRLIRSSMMNRNQKHSARS